MQDVAAAALVYQRAVARGAGRSIEFAASSTVVAAPGITRGLGWYFLDSAHLGFGGPIALIGAMHRDLVEQRRVDFEEEYREGIALAQLSPGPLSGTTLLLHRVCAEGIAGAALAG